MPTINGQYLTDDEYNERSGYQQDDSPPANADSRDPWDEASGTWNTAPGQGYNLREGQEKSGNAATDLLAGYSGKELDFLKRNQNPDGSYDFHRLATAFQGDNQGGPYDRQGPMYDQRTNQLKPGVRPPQSNYAAVFSDPLTAQYEQLLQAQLGRFQQQQAAMEQAAALAEQRRSTTGAAVDRLTGYVNERVGKLQGPAYTGTEQEVLRTQLLDPMERDRTAARQRALEQIGARGMDPSSGIAQQLLRDVDRAFDEQRTRSQGAIATRQIEEERSRSQEAQQLLQYLAMLPDAVARGDLDFVAYVQSLINQPGQQGLSVAQILADLPTQRLNDALGTLGVAPSSGNTSAQLMQLLQQQQQQRQLQQMQAAQAWGNIGWNALS